MCYGTIEGTVKLSLANRGFQSTEDAGLTVKRVYPDGRRRLLLCVSDNRAFPPFTVSLDEGRVEGRVLRWEQGEI